MKRKPTMRISKPHRTTVCSCPNCVNNRANLMSRISHAVYECLVCMAWFDKETGTIIREPKHD